MLCKSMRARNLDDILYILQKLKYAENKKKYGYSTDMCEIGLG